MCGRYVSPSQAAIERQWDLRNAVSDRFARKPFAESYNVAPSQQVPIIRVIREQGGKRELVPMRWGLVPFWAKGVAPKYSTINARAETVETAASYRGPWKRGQRCVFPVAGFYEWHVEADGTKQPWYIRPAGDNELFSIGGLWDESIDDSGATTLSCTIITLDANELLASIHNDKQRMPLILPQEAVETWLKGTADEAKALIAPYPSERMRAHPVSKRVNKPANNEASLIEAVA
jgi:putative SOS response-associated peptidase YedK